jgi:hypothetical protein
MVTSMAFGSVFRLPEGQTTTVKTPRSKERPMGRQSFAQRMPPTPDERLASAYRLFGKVPTMIPAPKSITVDQPFRSSGFGLRRLVSIHLRRFLHFELPTLFNQPPAVKGGASVHSIKAGCFPPAAPTDSPPMKKKAKPSPKLARCRICGNERPANRQEFSRQSIPRCSACRIGEMEYIGTKREPPKQ